MFKKITDKIRASCSPSMLVLEKVTNHDGYAWMPMKLPADDPITAYSIYWTNRKRGSGGDLAAVDSLVVEEVEGGEQSGAECYYCSKRL